MFASQHIAAATVTGALLFAAIAHADTEIYFSPGGGCEHRVVQLVDGAKSKIDAAIYSLNNEAIVGALKRAKTRGVKIRLLLDRTQASGNRETTLGLREVGLNVRIHSKNKIQHNKFAVFDGARAVTGSFNWTEPAERSNEENCVVLDGAKDVAAFNSRFEGHLWKFNSEERSIASFDRMKRKARE